MEKGYSNTSSLANIIAIDRLQPQQPSVHWSFITDLDLIYEVIKRLVVSGRTRSRGAHTDKENCALTRRLTHVTLGLSGKSAFLKCSYARPATDLKISCVLLSGKYETMFRRLAAVIVPMSFPSKSTSSLLAPVSAICAAISESSASALTDATGAHIISSTFTVSGFRLGATTLLTISQSLTSPTGFPVLMTKTFLTDFSIIVRTTAETVAPDSTKTISSCRREATARLISKDYQSDRRCDRIYVFSKYPSKSTR